VAAPSRWRAEQRVAALARAGWASLGMPPHRRKRRVMEHAMRADLNAQRRMEEHVARQRLGGSTRARGNGQVPCSQWRSAELAAGAGQVSRATRWRAAAGNSMKHVAET